MAADIPTIEPEEHQAGTTLRFDRCLPDFPSDTWTLSYYLANESDAPIEITAAANGQDHRVTSAYTETAAWNPGDYLMSGYVTDGTSKHLVYSRKLTIKPDPSLNGTVGWKSTARRMVESLEAVELQQAGNSVVSYSINGRSYTRQPWVEFMGRLGYWKGQLQQEESRGVTRRILIRRVGPR